MANARAEQTAALLRARRSLGLAGRRRRLPRQQPPTAIEREYAKAILGLLERARAELEPLLTELPVLLDRAARERQDAGEGKRVRDLISAALGRLGAAVSPGEAERLAKVFGERTATYQRIQLNRQVQAALGADIFASDRGIADQIDAFANENAELITNIPWQMTQRIAQATTRAIANATPHAVLAKEIRDEFGVAERRAKLIARDQVGKLYGQVNASRQKAMGVERFVWRTVHDERVRSEHRFRDGKEYSYADPPSGEIPGTPINCRCYADPVFDDILAESGAKPAPRKAPPKPPPPKPRAFAPVPLEQVDRYSDKFEAWYGELDAEQREALEFYQSHDGFRFMNGLARTGVAPKAVLPGDATAAQRAVEGIKQMDRAIQASKLPDDLVLYRGQRLDAVPQVGGVITDQGFLSTSIKRDIAADFAIESDRGSGVYLLEIEAPKGSTGAYMPHTPGGNLRDEFEIVLPRGARFEVRSLRQERVVHSTEGDDMASTVTVVRVRRVEHD